MSKCSECGRTFSTEWGLTVHMRRAHGIITAGEGPHACETCGKKFGERQRLRAHERSVHKIFRRRNQAAAKAAATSAAAPQRKPARRVKSADTASAPAVCYCPQCGLNLRALSAALAAVPHLKGI